MKPILYAIAACLLGSLSTPSLANPTVVLQVPQSYHMHPVRLLHPFMDYWHDRADAAQEVGTAAFQAQQYATASCQADAQGQALVVLEPNMFYNPKQGMFYSQITAKVYLKNTVETALEKPLLTVVTEGQSLGTLTHNAELFTHRAYQQAFDRLMVQLQQNGAFQQSLAQAPSQTYQALCTSIDKLEKTNLFY